MALLFIHYLKSVITPKYLGKDTIIIVQSMQNWVVSSFWKYLNKNSRMQRALFFPPLNRRKTSKISCSQPSPKLGITDAYLGHLISSGFLQTLHEENGTTFRRGIPAEQVGSSWGQLLSTPYTCNAPTWILSNKAELVFMRHHNIT